MELAIRLFSGISLIIGAVECFAGYKLMKMMTAIWAIFIGAFLGVTIGVKTGSAVFGVVMVLVLCVTLVILLYKFQSLSVLIMSTLLAFAAMYAITEKIFITIFFGIMVGTLIFFFEKPAIVVSKAFSGAGIILASAYIMMGMGVNGNKIVTTILWIPISLIGMFVQYVTTQKPKVRRRTTAFEKPTEAMPLYNKKNSSIMQKAYRNYCIKCGSKMPGDNERCSKCGFSFDD